MQENQEFPAHLRGLCLPLRCRAAAVGAAGDPTAQLLTELSCRDQPWFGEQPPAHALLRLHPGSPQADRLLGLSMSCPWANKAWPVEQSKSPINLLVPGTGLSLTLGLLPVPVNLHMGLYWALLLTFKVMMMVFHYLSRAERANTWWKHQSITGPPTPQKFPSMDTLICVCCAQNPL